MKRILAVLFGIFIVSMASAEETVELNPMEVRTAVIEADETTRFGGSVAVVGREQILDLNARGMADALRRVTDRTLVEPRDDDVLEQDRLETRAGGTSVGHEPDSRLEQSGER